MSEATIKPKTSYELYMLLNPASVSGNISEIEETIGKILQKHLAQIERSEKFSKKDLAYSIQKFNYAYAANIYFFAPAKAIDEIQKELNTSEIPFLRFMISKIEKKAKTSKPTRRTRIKPIIEKEAEKTTVLPSTDTETSKDVIKKSKEVTVNDDKDKVTLEEIDKRLDEIMEQL